MTETHKRPNPGVPLHITPMEIDGIFYDPYHPPKLYRTPDGKESYIGGKVIDRDEACSMMFWARGKPEGLRQVMQEEIERAAQKGQFACFAGSRTPKGKFELDQKDKEKLSAFRILAKEMNYTIGPFRIHAGAGTVEAPITKAPAK